MHVVEVMHKSVSCTAGLLRRTLCHIQKAKQSPYHHAQLHTQQADILDLPFAMFNGLSGLWLANVIAGRTMEPKKPVKTNRF